MEPNILVNLPNILVDLPNILVDLPNILIDLPNILVKFFSSVVSRCDHSISSLLLSLVYIMFLIFIVSFLALKAKGHRENHGEALYIAITIISSIILWCIWVAGAVTSQSPKDRDAFIAFGVVGNATIVFLIMFLPKGRQLAAMGRDSGHDDRDQLSSPSSPSVYTPSFLHIKPSSFHIPLTSKNGNFYKQFGGTNGSNGHIGSGNGHPTVKSITNGKPIDFFVCFFVIYVYFKLNKS